MQKVIQQITDVVHHHLFRLIRHLKRIGVQHSRRQKTLFARSFQLLTVVLPTPIVPADQYNVFIFLSHNRISEKYHFQKDLNPSTAEIYHSGFLFHGRIFSALFRIFTSISQ